MRALIAIAVVALAVIGIFIAHVGHRSAYIVVHRGQPMPTHYIEAWSFGNVTIVQVAPSHTEVSIGPWP